MDGQFISVGGRRLFGLRFHSGSGKPMQRVLVLPPFAEELNKSRRLLAETARALAARGCDVLMADLYGTGDSAGDFGDATWQLWLEDVEGLARWHEARAPAAAPVLLAVRSGALLLAAGNIVRDARIVAWQPVFDGTRLLQQFLRLRVMASKFAGREESVAQLQATLASGEPVEVAGYTIAPQLAAGLLAARLDAAALAPARHFNLFEIRPGAGGESSPVFSRFAAALTAAGGSVAAQLIDAEPFWMTQEIAAAPAVRHATVAAVMAG